MATLCIAPFWTPQIVEYSKLFRLLIKRQIPAVILRMLYNMYVSHVTFDIYCTFLRHIIVLFFMIAIFKTVTCIYHYCNMSEARRPFVVNKCMYVCTCVNWNGIISPILFCIYIDDLLSGLANLGVGCYIGNWYRLPEL